MTVTHVPADLGALLGAPGTLTVRRDIGPGSADLLREVVAAGAGSVLRIHRPTATVAFGRLDALRPGFEVARDVVRAAGYEPWVRDVGGRAAAYGPGCLVVDVASSSPDPHGGTTARFRQIGALLVTTLRDLGVDARVGPVPLEYCPGTYSVNARGVTKLAGTAQRVVRGGWLVSAVLTVTPEEPLRPLVTDVYRALDLPLDPDTVGAVVDEAPGVSVDQVEDALLAVLDHWQREGMRT